VRVSVHGSYSDWTNVISGIPQGSVLGPTLFIIYVNDLPDTILSFSGIFANDTKLYCPITSPFDIDLLQQDLNSVLDWCGTWLLFLNFIMSIGPKSTFRQYYFYIKNVAHPISSVQEEKGLGITFDEYSISKHIIINQIMHKANNVLGTIK